MAQENQRLKQLKTNYLLADFDFRTGVLPRRAFNNVIVDTLTGLLEAFDEVEPYYSDFRTEAEANYRNSLTQKVASTDQQAEPSMVPDLLDKINNPAIRNVIQNSGMNKPLRRIMGRDIPG